MAKTEHAPGPWRIEEIRENDTDPDCRIFAEIVTDQGIIAEIRGAVRIHGPDDVHPINMANAMLIAAAPDLLEALQQVMGWIDSWDPNFTQDGDWPEAAFHIRRAIAKATGK